MVNTSYTVRTKSNGNFLADYNTADSPNSITRGETTTFTFGTEIEGSTPDLVINDGETYTVSSGTEQYDSVSIRSGGTLEIQSGATVETNTLTNNGTLINNGTLVVQDGLVTSGALLSFMVYAGSYATVETLNGQTKYRSQLPPSEPVDSLAVGIEPSTDLQDRNVRGIWGLISGINDVRNAPLSIDRYEFEILVLGQLSDYTDHADLETNLKI